MNLYRQLTQLVLLLCLTQLAAAQDFEAIERRLGEGISAGELTIAQAHLMMQALKHGADSQRTANREQELNERMRTAARRLKAAVKSGELTEEQALEKWASAEREARTAKVAMRIHQAIAKGHLTEEEGRMKMDAIRAHVGRLARDPKGLGRKIRAAVARGDLTKEEAKAKLDAIGKAHRQAHDGHDHDIPASEGSRL